MGEVLEEGARVGRFVVVRSLGEGGMGMVYEARDPELARSVALKLLREESPTLGMRLLREGQVLAQLQHPNVVTIHALDLHAGRVFIAMELVDGETLDKHVARTKPGWRDIVALFVQAGHGLVAAHAKGIVHRDVKPANMLVDGSGRVRIGDFGLARQVDGDAPVETGPAIADRASMVTASGPTMDLSDAPSPDRPLAAGRLTDAGTVMGTPFFMSPEQLLGKPATAASDQFSFCVALWHALFGEHPFLIDAVVEGRRRERPASRGVPGWLMRALDRGLAVDPAARFPSMRALLDVLESHPARRRRVALAIAGVVAIAGTIVAVRLARTESDPCPAPDAGTVWNAARRTVLHDWITKLDPKLGASRVDVASRTVESFLATWRDGHVGACRATRVTGEQSDSRLDARMRCLRYRLAELDASLALVTTATDPVAVDEAIGGLVKLTPVAQCADPEHLAIEVAAPLPPGPRAKADAIMNELGAIEAGIRANRVEELPARAAAATTAARALAHPPTLAVALHTLARMEIIAEHLQAGEAALRELTQVAARANDARSEAFAWTKLVGVVGSSRGKPAEGLALVSAASAAIVRAGEPVDLRIDLLYAESEVLGEAAKLPEALVKLAEARKLLDAANGDDPASPFAPVSVDIYQQAGTAHAMSGDFDAAKVAYQKSIDLSRLLYGADNLDEAFAIGNLAVASFEDGKLDDALAFAKEALRIRELRTGPESARVAGSLAQLGTIYGTQKQWQLAHDSYQRALDIYRKTVPPDDQQLLDALLGVAWIDGELGDRAAELAGYDQVIAIFAKAEASTPTLGTTYGNRAEVEMKQKRYDVAIKDYERAIEVFELHYGKDSSYLVTPLASYGRCLVVAGKPADAIAPLERVLALDTKGGNEAVALGAKGWLGRALIESKRDATRGVTLAREARAALEGAPPEDTMAAGELQDLVEWMTKKRL